MNQVRWRRRAACRRAACWWWAAAWRGWRRPRRRAAWAPPCAPSTRAPPCASRSRAWGRSLLLWMLRFVYDSCQFKQRGMLFWIKKTRNFIKKSKKNQIRWVVIDVCVRTDRQYFWYSVAIFYLPKYIFQRNIYFYEKYIKFSMFITLLL